MDFYTYLWLREDGTPYYVGKGFGKRAFRIGCPTRERIILQQWTKEEEAFTAEKFLILFYGRKDIGTGILRNMTDGGEGSSNPSEDTRRAIGNWSRGKKKSLESVHKRAEKQRGHNRGRTGLKHSAESAARIAASIQEWWKDEQRRIAIAAAIRKEHLTPAARNRASIAQTEVWRKRKAGLL